MLPNLYWSTINLGPIVIQVWGLFVALGLVVGSWWAQRLARQQQLNPNQLVDLIFWAVSSAFIMSRVWYVVTEWSLFQQRWIKVLYVWEGGLSMTGGILGGILAVIIFTRVKRLNFWQYADLLAQALPLGVAIGRLGCFFIFDHPGTITDFFLGEVYYGDGLVRHNHGLYLALDGVVLFAVFQWLKQRYHLAPPWFMVIYVVWEGTLRLGLDFLRVADSRFISLTAAQWGGIVMIIAGIVIATQYQLIQTHSKPNQL